MVPGVTIAAAAPDELQAALRLAFGHLDPETRLARVAGGLELIEQGAMDPAGILVARSGNHLLGAMISAPVPGAGAAVWPPQVSVPPVIHGGLNASAISDDLVVQTLEWLRSKGVKLAQVLMTMDEVELAAPLLRNGFRRVTALWYLRHDLANLPPVIHAGLNTLTYTSFAVAGPEPFVAVLARTYEDTQDCPEISDARTVSEALAGHQADGFDPDCWWLATIDDEPIGLLLVNAAPDGDGWEIAYVGVVPEQRRRGYGRELVLKAILEAKAAGESQLSLAVDARNQPARELYRRLEFEATESREVLLAILEAAP